MSIIDIIFIKNANKIVYQWNVDSLPKSTQTQSF